MKMKKEEEGRKEGKTGMGKSFTGTLSFGKREGHLPYRKRIQIGVEPGTVTYQNSVE